MESSCVIASVLLVVVVGPIAYFALRRRKTGKVMGGGEPRDPGPTK